MSRQCCLASLRKITLLCSVEFRKHSWRARMTDQVLTAAERAHGKQLEDDIGRILSQFRILHPFDERHRRLGLAPSFT